MSNARRAFDLKKPRTEPQQQPSKMGTEPKGSSQVAYKRLLDGHIYVQYLCLAIFDNNASLALLYDYSVSDPSLCYVMAQARQLPSAPNQPKLKVSDLLLALK